MVMALAGVTLGYAGTTVWSFDKQKGNDMQPAYWYSYAQPEPNTTGVLTDTDDGYKQFSIALDLNSDQYSVAGFGFAWKSSGGQDVDVDLSTHSGLCITYKADRQFRLDLKQSTITDYNYYGTDLPAASEFTSRYIDFQNFAQEAGWGATVPLDLTKQLAIQMSYKAGHANSFGESDATRHKNVVTISAISLGECETVVEKPKLSVLEPYDKTQTKTIKETDSLKIPLADVFTAEEGSEVTIATSLTASNILTMVKPAGAPTLKDTLVYVSRDLDKDTSLTLTILALSGTESVKTQINVKITDEGEGPVGPTCPGDPECPDDPPSENHPTTVLAPYDVEATLVNMKEADTMKIALGDLFADEDNDKLTFVVEMSANLMKVLTAIDKATLSDTLKLVPSGVKKDTSFIVAVQATDEKSPLVKVSFVVTIKDSNTPPVAADTEFNVTEGESLIVPIVRGLATLGSDVDGDDFLVVPVDSTKHGKLTEFSQLGSFVYTPDSTFRGDDTLTYVLVETANHQMISNMGTVVIHVLPVNAKPTVTIADSAFIKDTLVLDMDFDEDTVSQIKISTKSLIFKDREVTEGTQKFTYKAVGTKIIAAVDSVNASYYYLSVKPVASATGVATIALYASDGADSVGVKFYVKLVSPADVAQAVKDEYTTFNDSTLTVDAKKGVLANDKYPEGVTKGMTAELAQKPAHGTLTLNKDGSFKYVPASGYEGVDYFGYYAVVNGTKSKAAVATIAVEKRNLVPTVVVKSETLDTTVTEDFPTSRALKYASTIVASWFKDPEGDPLTYSAKSKDGKLKVQITDKGILEINSAPDSTGKAYVVVTATDKKSGSKSFEFCVTIKPVNDKPVLLHADTAYVAKSDWKVKWDLDTLVTDVDGDELTFTPNETTALSKYVTIAMKGSVITVTAKDGVKFKDDQKINIGVSVSDPDKQKVTIPLYIIVGEPPVRSGLKPQLAQPKMNWQNAVMAKRGTAKIMDMKGRVVWNAKLPVNPAEVMNASAQVQGRKILRVNNQTWTIK
jgi:hypothetical protein